MLNSEKSAFPQMGENGLTKLEYALIHSTWEPTKDEIETQGRYDRNKNQYNEPHKPPLRSCNEIIIDLKLAHFTDLLNTKK